MTIAGNIKRLRKEKKMTQKQLAEKCGMYESQIRKYELGTAHPKLDTIRKISKALDVYMNEIIEDWSQYSKEDHSEDLQRNREFYITISEQEHITKYRSLDDPGRTHVDAVLDWEAKRSTQAKDAQDRIAELERQATILPLREAPAEYLGNAAHARTDIETTDEMREHDDAIMDGEDF